MSEEEKMTKRLSRVIAIVVFMLVIGCGSAAAYGKSIPVIINLDGVPRMVNTDKETVGELMASIDELMDAEYILEDVNEESQLSSNMVINLSSITEKIVTKKESIAFDTEIRENPNLMEGEEKVIQEGKDGALEIYTTERYSGDKLVSSQITGEKLIQEAQNKIIERGTKSKNQIDGYTYSKAINVKATGYTPYDAGCNGITATGTQAKKGVIAVDPNVIPLGTKVYIPGYGKAIAEDVGGAIKGNKIDLCYTSKAEAFGWGVRNVTVYILND
jgi:3D (Asp-Asp-Asp) domain-containing protein